MTLHGITYNLQDFPLPQGEDMIWIGLVRSRESLSSFGPGTRVRALGLCPHVLGEVQRKPESTGIPGQGRKLHVMLARFKPCHGRL